ncbi:MAG: glycosyltransferase, partial [Halioglobus sp.]
TEEDLGLVTEDGEHGLCLEENWYSPDPEKGRQDRYDITYIFNNDVTLADYKDWFDIDLTPSSMKIIRIPFFEERQRYTPDEGMVLGEPTNPFDIIARETLNYDIFINANMLGKVNPLSPQSIFVCHFPDQEKTRFFQVDQYDHLIINGDYTGSWVRKRWDLEPTEKLYPPVNMFNPESTPEDKEKIILSVARFEISGSKKQAELARSWGEMCRKNPEATAGWRLVMIGGSTPENTYVDEVEEAIVKAGNPPVEIIANAELRQIRDHYRRASIFWHACGLDEERPERVEHFGMTTVESMQNCCVPVVIDGGGQREIVVHGECGYRFGDLEELKSHTLKVMTDPDLRLSMARSALERSKLFGMEVFKEQLFTLLDQVDAELMGRDLLPMTRSAS